MAQRPDPLELEEIRELELEFLEELMSEPAGGHNHGRRRAIGGEWTPLETDPQDAPSWKRTQEPRTHGTSYTYDKIKCRCAKCRAWKSSQNAAYRQRKATPGNEE